MLKDDIRINAGVIWSLLAEKGALSLRKIGELTSFRESYLYLAIGWLAREDKIRFFDDGGTTCVELIGQSVPEMYFG
jgi:hypothetical protein